MQPKARILLAKALIERHMISKGVGRDTCKQFFDRVKSARISYETITTGPMGIVFDDTEIRSQLAEYLGMVGQKYDWQYCSQDQATKAEPKRRPKNNRPKRLAMPKRLAKQRTCRNACFVLNLRVS